MENRFSGSPGAAQARGLRREGIRAGAVSGPWRATPRPADATGQEPVPRLMMVPRRTEQPATPEPGRSADMLPEAPPEPAAEVFTRDGAPEPAAPPPLMAGRPVVAGHGQASIVWAVLLGGGIAVAIVCLAFFLRPSVAGERGAPPALAGQE